jgi:hypothetical protein
MCYTHNLWKVDHRRIFIVNEFDLVNGIRLINLELFQRIE